LFNEKRSTFTETRHVPWLLNTPNMHLQQELGWIWGATSKQEKASGKGNEGRGKGRKKGMEGIGETPTHPQNIFLVMALTT